VTAPEPPPPDPLAAGNQRIRDAAKWLIASSAAVGAALIAGSQLSSIGRLDVGWPTTVATARLWVAAAGVLLGLTAVAYVIWTSVAVLLPVLVLVSDLDEHWDKPSPAMRPAVTFFREHRKFLQGVDSPAGLIDRRAELIRRLPAEDVTDEIAKVDTRIQAVEDMANHQTLKAMFQRSLRRLLAAAALIAIGIVAFAWAANPPPKPTTADLRGARLAGAVLRDADLRGAKLDGADLSRADLTGADLTGAALTGVTWSATICPDGSNSDENGRTCRGHLARG